MKTQDTFKKKRAARLSDLWQTICLSLPFWKQGKYVPQGVHYLQLSQNKFYINQRYNLQKHEAKNNFDSSCDNFYIGNIIANNQE